MPGKKYGRRLDSYVPNYVIFDLETTGVSCNRDRIIEISAVKVVNSEVVDEFSELVNPECDIPYYASRVNGITDAMVEDARTFSEVLPDFLKFIGNSILVGHNIHSFDMKFLYRECKVLYGEMIMNDYVDTLYVARRLVPELAHHKLVDLANYFNIPAFGAHRALNDCYMNQKVFECLGQL